MNLRDLKYSSSWLKALHCDQVLDDELNVLPISSSSRGMLSVLALSRNFMGGVKFECKIWVGGELKANFAWGGSKRRVECSAHLVLVPQHAPGALRFRVNRGISRIRNTAPVGPYSSPTPRDLWWS